MTIVTCSSCGAKNRVKDDVSARLTPTCGKCGKPLDQNKTRNSDRPIYVTDANFAQILEAAGNTPILIDCWAEWCGPCRAIGPIMEQLASESGGRYQIGKLNVDENPQTAARYHISSIPTMLLFKGGELLDRLIGAQPKEVIAAHLSQVV